VKLKGDRAWLYARTLRRPGLQSIYYDKKRGWIMRAWPRKRTKEPTLRQKYAVQALCTAAYVAKRATPWEIEAAQEAVKGTGWTWKDYYISAQYGRAVVVTDTDGNLFVSRNIMASEIQLYLDSITTEIGAMLVRTGAGWLSISKGSAGSVLTVLEGQDAPSFETPNVQLILDLLGSEAGDVLVRTADGWAALAPGESGTVLTAGDPGEAPSWIAPKTGGVGDPYGWVGNMQIDPTNNTITSPNFWSGIPWSFFAGQQIDKIAVWSWGASSSLHVTAALYATDPTNNYKPGSLLAQSDTLTTIAEGWNYLPLLTPLTIDTDRIVYFGRILTGGNMASGTGMTMGRFYFSTTGDTPPSTAGTVTIASGNVATYAAHLAHV
jgi:hypothetical protein